MTYPQIILHWINGKETSSMTEETFPKIDPANGRTLARVTVGKKRDVDNAILKAEEAYSIWKKVSVIDRGRLLRKVAELIFLKKEEMAEIINNECGKSKKSALGEVDAAIECGYFFAGEGQRFYGKILQSSRPGRSVSLIRESIGVGALFVPFNNPLASIAWKTFPALLCGNTVVLKSHEYTPFTAIAFAEILKEAGIPDGVFNVLQGTGSSIGVPLVSDDRIRFISFTGSSKTGSEIVERSAKHLPKVSIEAGGKNPVIVCDDADMEHAADEVIAGAFIDGGQRCAATSRIIIFEKSYDSFKNILLQKIKKISVGTSDHDTYGAIISKERADAILETIKNAKKNGGKILCGGEPLSDVKLKKGFFIAPTLIEGVSKDDGISQNEIFGPVVVLFKAKDYAEALSLANSNKYGLSSAIHTKSIDMANAFIHDSCSGVVRVNGPTHGSEPHMPFGGFGLSGNGSREPGVEALDFYSEWKQTSIDHNLGKS